MFPPPSRAGPTSGPVASSARISILSSAGKGRFPSAPLRQITSGALPERINSTKRAEIFGPHGAGFLTSSRVRWMDFTSPCRPRGFKVSPFKVRITDCAFPVVTSKDLWAFKVCTSSGFSTRWRTVFPSASTATQARSVAASCRIKSPSASGFDPGGSGSLRGGRRRLIDSCRRSVLGSGTGDRGSGCITGCARRTAPVAGFTPGRAEASPEPKGVSGWGGGEAGLGVATAGGRGRRRRFQASLRVTVEHIASHQQNHRDPGSDQGSS